MSGVNMTERSGFPAAVLVAQDADGASRAVAERVARSVGRGAVNLALATGGSMAGVYAELARLARARELSFGDVHAYMLDEYLDLPAESAHSFRAWLDKHLLGPLGMSPERVHGLGEVTGSGGNRGVGVDRAEAARCYEELISARGGIDLCLLGIGANGHVAFNEPGSAADSRARVVELHATTRAAAAPTFGSMDAVPVRALTLGLANLRECRTLCLLALGEHKAEAVRRFLVEPVTPDLPASLLREHPRLTVILDRAAACLLPESGG
ncbi:MAG: hypothetical protein CMK00_06960 [Planctomycetes bacterium]|nr:hypothetical protein [Planctomycetota bacterium]HJO26686.1 glucosamine-6-phosphate deaminase [Planctomycetota bacterium]